MTSLDSASLNFWENFADVGTWLVIIGVTGEGLEITLKILEHKVKNEEFLHWCEKHEFSIDVWGSIFWIMVVLGLAAEFKGNHKAQQAVKSENSRITEQAGEAIKQAGLANERAASLELRAADAELKLAEITNNVAKIDPRKQPIISAAADAMILMTPFEPVPGIEHLARNVGATNMQFRVTGGSVVNSAWLDLGRSSQYWHSFGVELLSDWCSESLDVIGTNTYLRFDIHFGDDAHKTQLVYETLKEKPLTLNDLDSVYLILPIQGEVFAGRVDLVVEGTKRRFGIPKQKTAFWKAGSVETNGTFIPLKIDLMPPK